MWQNSQNNSHRHECSQDGESACHNACEDFQAHPMVACGRSDVLATPRRMDCRVASVISHILVLPHYKYLSGSTGLISI